MHVVVQILEQAIAAKAALTEATGLLPKKHADYSMFKSKMLPKMAVAGKAKQLSAEIFEKYDRDGDGVLSKEEFHDAQSKFRAGAEAR